MPAKKPIDPEVAAKATADLAAGDTIDDVAKRYGLARSTAGDRSPGSKRGRAKIRKLADLQDLEAIFRRQLALNFAALEALTTQVIDAEWLAQRSGDEIVALYNTLFAKSGKLLGALYGPPAGRLDTGESDAGDEDPAS